MKIQKAYQENFEKLTEWEQNQLMDLAKFLENGGVPSIVLFSISPNGMSRKMSFLWVKDNQIQVLNSNLIRKLRGKKQTQSSNFKVICSGMDPRLLLLLDIKEALGVSNGYEKTNLISFKD